MSIHSLRIQNLRCFSSEVFELSPQINCIIAENGEGKTSFLEAVYMLSCGHSFRSRDISSLIRFSQSAATIFAKQFNGDTVSIQKSITKKTRIKVNASPCSRTSDLAYKLPCQIYYQDLFSVIDGGATVRRKILDWGMFHVEHCYHANLKKYNQLLKQRNALLRQKKEKNFFEPWDVQLAQYGNVLHGMRQHYVAKLSEIMKELLQQLTSVNCELLYYKGWDKRNKGLALFDQLQENYEKDLYKGYTSSGAHQADLDFSSEGIAAKELLSRGQKKIVLIALKIAQTKLIEAPCIHLFDDIFSELDTHHTERLLNMIFMLKGQCFLTLLKENVKYLNERTIEKKIYL